MEFFEISIEHFLDFLSTVYWLCFTDEWLMVIIINIKL